MLPDAGLPISPVPVPSDNPEGFFRTFYSAVSSSAWKAVAVLVLILAIWAFRTWGGKKWPWVRSDRGGAVLAVALSMACAVGGVVGVGGPVSFKMVLDGLLLGFTTGGGWAVVKKLLTPPVPPEKPAPPVLLEADEPPPKVTP